MGEVKNQCDLKYKGGKCGQHPHGLMYEDLYIYIACCIEKIKTNSTLQYYKQRLPSY